MAKDKTSFVVADSASGSKDKGGSTGASSDMSFYGSGKIGPPQDTGVFDGGGADIADTAMSASGSFVPWAEIVRQIVGHIVRGGSAAMDYTKQRRRTKAAWEQAHMSNILGIIDMKLENERQEIRRESMMEALAVIDEGFGHGTTEKAAMNRKAIRSVINQIERADAERCIRHAGGGGRPNLPKPEAVHGPARRWWEHRGRGHQAAGRRPGAGHPGDPEDVREVRPWRQAGHGQAEGRHAGPGAGNRSAPCGRTSPSPRG